MGRENRQTKRSENPTLNEFRMAKSFAIYELEYQLSSD